MAKKIILGTDIARDAFKTKVNENFTELYDKDATLEGQINSLVPEEGTFTPIVKGLSTAGTCTYATRLGRFIKIGNVVYFAIYVDWSSHTGVGQLIVDGLPFASASDFYQPISLIADKITFSEQLAGRMPPTATYIALRSIRSGQLADLVSIGTNAGLYITGTYII